MSKVSSSSILRIANKISSLPTKGFQWISGGALVAIMCLITLDVILRASLNEPIEGSYELSQLLMVCVASFAFAYTQVYRGHIDIPVLSQRFPKRVQAVLECSNWLIGSVLFAFVAWKSASHGLYKVSEGQVTLALEIPIGPFYFVICAGCILFSLVLMANFIEALARVKR